MGTRFEIVLGPAVSEVELRAAGEAAIEEINEWHRRLTRFDPDSFVSHLNRTAWQTPVQLDEEAFALFADATRVWRDSGGAFDVTVGTGEFVLNHRERTIGFRQPQVSLDLGAIGKGHALDCAAALLRRLGVAHAFLHGGASSGIAIGKAPDAGPWRVALGSEDGPFVALENEAFSVSDTHTQTTASGAGHIVDPRVGERATGRRSRVAVVGRSARLADAWSTALAVLGDVPSSFPQTYTAHWL